MTFVSNYLALNWISLQCVIEIDFCGNRFVGQKLAGDNAL